MDQLPKKLQQKLAVREASNSLRVLSSEGKNVDFSSNDYLGFSTSESIYQRGAEILKTFGLERNGATGSRLISGNHELYHAAEDFIATFHQTPSALIFNSGYDANLGLLGSVPQKGDIILYDAQCHASIRDGIRLSHAKAHRFAHNDPENLKKMANRHQSTDGEVYVVTESVFSMDGDQPDLKALSHYCTTNNYHLIVDEAHALGVLGVKGEGLVQHLGLENDVFARIVTFGKGLGCHGAAILGSEALRGFLINFARSFIYTTGLPPHAIATILAAYQQLSDTNEKAHKLNRVIAILRSQIKNNGLESYFIPSDSAIHSCIIPGNDRVKHVAEQLKKKGFDVKPILSPTVAVGQERLRICLHSFNTEAEIKNLVELLVTFVQ